MSDIQLNFNKMIEQRFTPNQYFLGCAGGDVFTKIIYLVASGG